MAACRLLFLAANPEDTSPLALDALIVPLTSLSLTSPLAVLIVRSPITELASMSPLAVEMRSKLYFMAFGTWTSKRMLALQLRHSW